MQPSDAASNDPASLETLEKALLGEERRLRSVAESNTDNSFVETVADLCTPTGLNDAQAAGDLFTAFGGSVPSQAIVTDSVKMEKFRLAQREVQSSALFMAEIQSRCEQGNAALLEADARTREQVDDAHREQAIIFGLIAARLSAPSVNVNANSTQGY